MNKIFSIGLMALAFASCQNSTDNDTTDALSSDSITMSAPTAAMANDESNPAAVTTAAPASAEATPPQTAGAASTPNPEHGKPGHRCDIPVGAPLNSPAGKTQVSPLEGAAPGMTMSPPSAQPAAAPVTGGAGQRINPAHGRPGHDCAVPVGQPLKG